MKPARLELPTPAWLGEALAKPATTARPEKTTCVASVDVDDLIATSKDAMERGSPQRITIEAYSLYGMGCPCYEQFGTSAGSILPFYVRGLTRRPGPGHAAPASPRGELYVDRLFHGSPNLYIFRDANAAAVAKRHGAKGIEREGTSSVYFLSFEGAGRAIDAIPGLLCDPDVESAAIGGVPR